MSRPVAILALFALVALTVRTVAVEALELRLVPVASQGVGWESSVFVIEDRVERGREESDFSTTSKLDATLIANLAPRWAARVRYGLSLTEFLDPENSNTNFHGGELSVGRAIGGRLVADAGVRGAMARVHGFRLNDNDRIGGFGRLRFQVQPGESLEAAYEYAERGFPRRVEMLVGVEEPVFLFGPVVVGGGDPVIRSGDTQRDRENSASLTVTKEILERLEGSLAGTWRHNDSNFANGRWGMVGGGAGLRVRGLPWDGRLSVGFRYARRSFEELEISEGETRADNIFDASATLQLRPLRWLGISVRGGALLDRANADRGDFDATSVALVVNVNPPETWRWGRPPVPAAPPRVGPRGH